MAWRMWIGGLTGLMVALVVATVVNSHGLIGNLIVGGFTIAGLIGGSLWEDRVLTRAMDRERERRTRFR